MLSLKRGYTCEEAVLIAMDQLPQPPRRASAHTAFVRGMCPFDERSHKLGTLLAVESLSFGRLGVEGSQCGGGEGRWVDGMEMSGEGTPTPSNRLGDTISRRVSRFKLQLRAGQESRRSRGGGVTDSLSMAWGWSLDAA